MGRPERELDPEAGPVQRFACDLRRLRREAGSPPYRELANRAKYSVTVLSRAASGRELPSLAVTLAYVGACGGDQDYWRASWYETARQLNSSDTSDTKQDPGRHDVDSPSGWPHRNALMVGGAVTLVLMIGIVGWAAWPFGGHDAALPRGQAGGAARTSRLPHDGADPKAADCIADAVTIASEPIRLTAPVTAAGQSFRRGTVIGTVELRYSPRCMAAWSRVTPTVAFDHPLSGKEIVGVVRPADNGSSRFQPGHVEEAYTDLLSTGPGCVSAYAIYLIADGHRVSARTACRQHP
jgi:hypothetical protein